MVLCEVSSDLQGKQAPEESSIHPKEERCWSAGRDVTVLFNKMSLLPLHRYRVNVCFRMECTNSIRTEKAAEQLEITPSFLSCKCSQIYFKHSDMNQERFHNSSVLKAWPWPGSISIIWRRISSARSQLHLKSMNWKPWWWCMTIWCAYLVHNKVSQPHFYKTWRILKEWLGRPSGYVI